MEHLQLQRPLFLETEIEGGCARLHLLQEVRVAFLALVELTDGTGELPSMTGQFESAIARDMVRAQHLKFAAKDRELLNAELQVELGVIAVPALALDDNPIPPSVLDLIEPMLKD